jgi:murein DD-endopeptidase MepM/ murein hydrolase activator NlpD
VLGRALNFRSRLPWVVGIAGLVALVTWFQAPCGPFPEWETSSYVLPYPVHSSYFVTQSSCTNGGHRDAYRYSYDFSMPIGSTVTAARDGVVADIRIQFRDGQRGESESNWVKIRHADGTIAAYAHLTEKGALVKVGDAVVVGQAVGLSGNTGNTGGRPHLHFHVSPCAEPARCGTRPITFRNTDPNPQGLDAQRFYRALPYGKAGT